MIRRSNGGKLSADPVSSRGIDAAVVAPEAREQQLQRKPAGPQAAAGYAPAPVHHVLRSPGQPLDAATRAFMEPRFGQDFSKVRVHTDAKAAESAKAVQAQAYAVGRNMVFAPGMYAPTTVEGSASTTGNSFTDFNIYIRQIPVSCSFPFGSDIHPYFS